MQEHVLTRSGLQVALRERRVSHPFLPLVEARTETMAATVVRCQCGYTGDPNRHHHHVRRLKDGGEDSRVFQLWI